MATSTVPEGLTTLSQRADWFHLQAGCACERMRYFATHDRVDGATADFLFLIADELQRQIDAFSPVVGDLRRLEDVSQVAQVEEVSA